MQQVHKFSTKAAVYVRGREATENIIRTSLRSTRFYAQLYYMKCFSFYINTSNCRLNVVLLIIFFLLIFHSVKFTKILHYQCQRNCGEDCTSSVKDKQLSVLQVSIENSIFNNFLNSYLLQFVVSCWLTTRVVLIYAS